MTILIEAMMKRTISAVEARQNLGDLLSGVLYRNDEVVIERAGKAMGVLVPMHVYEAIERQRENAQKLVERARQALKDVPEEVLEKELSEERKAVRSEHNRKRMKPAS